MPDYTIGIAERIATLPDSTGTANSVHQNDFTVTSQSVINTVNVAIAPDAPTTLNPTPQTTFVTATNQNSIDTYGVQETDLVVTILATTEDAGILANYMIRSVPAYWFSNLQVMINALTDTQKDTIAQLEIGQQIAVVKTFPAGVVPQTVTEYLFVEGIDHEITVDSHTVTIYTGPATTYLQWLLGNYATTQTRTNLLQNPNFEIDANYYGVTGTGTTIARTTATSYVGSACGLWSYVSTTVTPVLVAQPGTASNRISVTPGNSYTFSIYVYDTNAGIYQAYFRWATAITGGTTTDNYGSLVTITPNTWTRYTVSATAPVGYTFAEMRILKSANAITGSTYVDAAMVEQSASVSPYFDGTYANAYTGYTLTYQAWDGTADASTSTTVWGLNSSGTGSPLNDATYGLA